MAEAPPGSRLGHSNEATPRERELFVSREHTWSSALFIMSGLSMCITVDILQYSMPLAFLPSVLEDRGHAPLEIATAIGIYYWTGFLGGLCITSYQVYRVLCERQTNMNEVTSYLSVIQYIKYLIIGLGIGTATLFLQAWEPSMTVHTGCRFIQGFAGAFIFFYTFLLSVALFREQQQICAMTFASCALNVAEVFGSFFGAVIFDLWGQRSVFVFLGCVSIVNQAFLIKILYKVEHVEVPVQNAREPLSRQGTPMLEQRILELEGPDAAGRVCGCLPRIQPGALDQFKEVLRSRPLACTILLITMAAVVKGSVEEMLPFHADHRWGYDPMEIGKLFCTIAITYILAAAFVGQFWHSLGHYQIIFSAYWLLMLGIVAWAVFAVVTYYRDSMYLTVTLAAYGLCLGMTHTPAALLLASVIDHEEGAAKDAVNGIWNTMWEAGGSLGFLFGGLLAERYHEQMSLLTGCGVCCAAVAFLMVAISSWPEDGCDCLKPKEGKTLHDPVKLHDPVNYGALDEGKEKPSTV